MPQTIDLGSLQLRYLQSKEDTDGSIDVFEMTLQPGARMPIPHYHDRWDETIYGLPASLPGGSMAKISISRPAKPSLSSVAWCMASRTARPRRQRASASSTRACSARSISWRWPRCCPPAPRSGQDEGNHAAIRIDSGASGVKRDYGASTSRPPVGMIDGEGRPCERVTRRDDDGWRWDNFSHRRPERKRSNPGLWIRKAGLLRRFRSPTMTLL